MTASNLDDGRRELSERVGQVARLWRVQLDRQLRPLGLSFLQWLTLSQLARADDDVVQKDLAVLVGLEGPTMVGLLDRLVRADFVQRRVAVHDRRANTVHLTDAGRQVLAASEHVLGEVRESLLQDLTPGELDATVGVLTKIAMRAKGGPGGGGAGRGPLG